MTPFPKILFTNKGAANNGINTPSCPFPALVTPFPVIAFTNEEATGYISEEAIGAINEAGIGPIIAGTNQPSCFFTSCFTVSLAPSINRLDFSSDSTI